MAVSPDLTMQPRSSEERVLVSVSGAARIKGVAKQTIHEKVRRLTGAGLLTTERRGKEIVFSLAEYDRAANETTDPARLAAQDTTRATRGEEAPAEPERDPTYNQQLTRKAGFEADLKEIEVRKRMGELLEIDDVRDAMTHCAEVLVREIGQLAAHAEDIASAVGRNGAGGAREVLRGIERNLRATVARAMTLAATGSDDEDETGEEQQDAA